MEELIRTANINEKWLDNIYENIKNLENYERLVREGCTSLLDFVNMPLKNRPVVIGLTQFKNLRFLITEFKLLLGDLTPVLDSSDYYDEILKKIDKCLIYEKLFINSEININKEIVNIKPTPFFYETLDIIHDLKRELFKKIKHILYIGSDNNLDLTK